MRRSCCQFTGGDGPLVAAAIHNGHAIRREMAVLLAIDEKDRLREEDPWTGELADVAPTRIVCNVSRFEFDLNRPRDKAVYLGPQDAWGLDIWVRTPSPAMFRRSLIRHDAFYRETKRLLSSVEGRYGKFVVFDLHSYNYRRGGPSASADDPLLNPDINIGTGTMDRKRWASVVERLMHELASARVAGRTLDVRENVKFRGGYFPAWIHGNFPASGCAIAIECKKIFMDEWTGAIFRDRFEGLKAALGKAAQGVLDELGGTF
ncbi:N-formylglutamate amidohydrolase [Prosthecochloris sp. GSB1]|uniref:N-formylglutamate amidohydrolase n=1 Tax=Prosthecochloris sp. GSB1 TaxID=281093 RepID=UPI000B8D0AEB|nr:N-formylglutamate amidohydrolase [Prosthecochloris sp. GSB1]ASQ91722.1 N-formylglutamate amidohydrolase [Prosthecochloris sp. GSB1]